MKEYKIEIPVKVKSVNELTNDEKPWMDAAIDVAKKAYAPYSSFQVGAVVVLANDILIMGNNQENAAYPSGLCAERVALFAAGANHPDIRIKAIVIVAIKDGLVDDKISPCGACRQVLVESEARNKLPIRILLCGREEVRIIDSASALLPFSFNAGHL